jgi:hypothetical protein
MMTSDGRDAFLADVLASHPNASGVLASGFTGRRTAPNASGVCVIESGVTS